MYISKAVRKIRKNKYGFEMLFGDHTRICLFSKHAAALAKHKQFNDRIRKLNLCNNTLHIMLKNYEESRHDIILQMARFLLHNNKIDPDYNLEGTQFGDDFIYTYWNNFYWLETISMEHLTRLLLFMEQPFRYRRIYSILINKGAFDVALFLRLLYETGLTPSNVYRITDSCIREQVVYLNCLKTGNPLYCPNGKLPTITSETERLIHTVHSGNQLFTKSIDYYRRKVQRIWTNKIFSIHSLRQANLNPEVVPII